MIVALLLLILLAILFPGFMRAIFGFLIGALLLAMVVHPAQSAEDALSVMPKYDVEGGCKYLVNAPYLYNKCIGDEQDAYDFMKAVWPELSAFVRGKCIETMEQKRMNEGGTGHYMYSIFSECVMNWREAEKQLNPNLPKSKFRP